MTATKPAGRAAVITEGQVSSTLIGLLAIAVILAINFLARPQLAAADARLAGGAPCVECGTVVAVRRSAHSVPVTFVEVQMPDGSLRTLRGPSQRFSVGDVVGVRGDALTLRDLF